MELDRQARAFLLMSRPHTRIYELDAVAAREMVSSAPDQLGGGPAVAEVCELKVPVGGGSEIPARRYSPADPHGTIVWLHGGGWVFDGLEEADAMCRTLATASGASVIDVDYRVAPEHPFPVPLDDCYDALVWLAEHEAAGPLVLGGDSAGGNMAAVCALRARDSPSRGTARGVPTLLAQVLIYPITNCDLATPAYLEHGEDERLLLGSAEMAWFFDQYVPDPAARGDPEVSPLRAAEHSGLPPAIVLVAEYDPLRDDGLRYAQALRDAGVQVTLLRHDDQPHGFFSQVQTIDASRDAVTRIATLLRAMIDAAG